MSMTSTALSIQRLLRRWKERIESPNYSNMRPRSKCKHGFTITTKIFFIVVFLTIHSILFVSVFVIWNEDLAQTVGRKDTRTEIMGQFKTSSPQRTIELTHRLREVPSKERKTSTSDGVISTGMASKWHNLLERTVNEPLNQTARVEIFPCHYMLGRENGFKIEPFFYNTNAKSNISTNVQGDFDVSIVTMMHPSSSMLSRLTEIINRWSGPISVAIFIKSQADTEFAHHLIQEYRSNQTSSNLDRIHLHLVTDMDESRGKDINVFPRNLLRNVALENSNTDHVLLMDMDLAPSQNAYENILHHLKALNTEPRTIEKYALVIPAFQKSTKYTTVPIARTKEELLRIMKYNPKAYDIFLRSEKISAHRATNYNRWYNATEESELPPGNRLYPVEKYEPDYEPYIVIRKDSNLPPFWEHFTGFGRNKLQWIQEVKLSGHKFLVAPDCFVIHQNHKKYGIRKVRPFIADEYVLRFQKYLQRVYGRSIQSSDSLQYWRGTVYGKWSTIAKSKGGSKLTPIKEMHEKSIRRMKEFDACMDKVSFSEKVSHGAIHEKHTN